jgi:hypothetical protein
VGFFYSEITMQSLFQQAERSVLLRLLSDGVEQGYGAGDDRDETDELSARTIIRFSIHEHERAQEYQENETEYIEHIYYENFV